jgi:methionyl-tRNA synthetase
MGAGKEFLKFFCEDEEKTLTLPYDVPANQFMNLEGQKISGSRNWAVWGLDFLSRYDPDALRYYLTVNMPESRDTDWSWSGFLARNNNELVATWGNLANRVLSFAYKHWGGIVPAPGELRQSDMEILTTVEDSFNTIGMLYDRVKLRAALSEIMQLSTMVNQYLDQNAPWKEIKTDKESAGKTIFTALKLIDSIKILISPILPFSSEQLHFTLGYKEPLFGDQSIEKIVDNLGTHQVLRYLPQNSSGRWEPSKLIAGTTINKPKPLFQKLDDKIIEEERERLGK